ncbi:MAG: ABC transporter permease [Clostridiales bacterium]|nr:ABC transporter permease [Clostridiales bacterium]
MLYGGRFSLGLDLLVSIIGMVLGIFFGAIFGYYGGKVDNISMRVMDIWQAIPSTLLAILISTALGSGFIQTVIALTVGGIPGSIRGTRAMVLKEREMDYLEAARAMNCSDFKIIFKHMVPNVLSPTIVGTTMHIGSTIMEAASLSYIGLGVQPPTPEWGAILADGKSYILSYPHLLVYPGIAIALTVLAFNLFGDGLRDALDPRLKD